MKKSFYITLLVLSGFLLGELFGAFDVVPDEFQPDLGGAGVYQLTGAGTRGEVLVSASNDTRVVVTNTARTYLEICKTNSVASNVVISMSVNASASHSTGITLSNFRPCFISNDNNLVMGGFWAIASPSAASLSYQQW